MSNKTGTGNVLDTAALTHIGITMRSKEQQSGTQPHELLKVPDELLYVGKFWWGKTLANALI